MEKIVLTSSVIKDAFTEYVCDNYDLQTREEVVTEIPMFDTEDLAKFEWNVGVILGNSGSGKSTILSRLGSVVTPHYENKSVISQFDFMDIESACELLHGVGLSSIPTWLRKPWELSNGERARLDLAIMIAHTPQDQPIVIDEFTSVVNRAAAQSMSFGLQRYLRTHNRKVILASCHFDIIEWLRPDWIYNLNKVDGEDNDLERMIYKDDEEYVAYPKINEKECLSDAREVRWIQ